MKSLTADQIIQRIANANTVQPEKIRPRIEQALVRIEADNNEKLIILFPDRQPTTEELIVALEHELYNVLMPIYPGWEWVGDGYRNVRFYRE